MDTTSTLPSAYIVKQEEFRRYTLRQVGLHACLLASKEMSHFLQRRRLIAIGNCVTGFTDREL